MFAIQLLPGRICQKKLFQRESDQQVHLYSRDRKFCDEALKVFLTGSATSRKFALCSIISNVV